MADLLVASFIKQFPGGAVIQADLRSDDSTQSRSTGGNYGVTVLFGPSGCGKTTILRCLAGLERPDQGVIQFAGETWFDAQQGLCLPPQQRRIGLVFQDYALFPHLTVESNVGYALRHHSRAERLKAVGDILKRFDLIDVAHCRPRQLSGGQQQRVALARSLVVRPRLLLLDEPLSALDATLRETLRSELRSWLTACDIPVVLVTHDRTEALTLGDDMVVMSGGKTLQSGPVMQVFNQPANAEVARIVGFETLQPGRVLKVSYGLATVQVGTATLLGLQEPGCVGNASVFVGIRAEDVVLTVASENTSSARNRITAVVQSLHAEFPMVRVELDGGFPLRALVTRQAVEELDLRPGARVSAWIKAPHVRLIAR